MYRLYGTLGTGACAVQAALCEADADFELVEVSTREGQHMTESYRRIKPRQQVPALALPDGSVMSEGAAILLHIAEAHPAARLAPVPGDPVRAQHDRWLVFFAVNVYEGELRKLFGGRHTDDPQGGDAVQRAVAGYVERHYLIFEDVLEPAPYACGEDLSVLDIYVWMRAHGWTGLGFAATVPRYMRSRNRSRNGLGSSRSTA